MPVSMHEHSLPGQRRRRNTNGLSVGGRATDERRLLLNSESGAMAMALDLARGVSATNTTVLLAGETGTGKEIIARWVHKLSERRDGPFIAVNCGALSPHIVESELFGHERGAFSGAVERRMGYFESANRGTLVLDEISELPFAQQTRLLRVLQEREVQRVGGSRSIAVDVRVIATTNRDLVGMVAEGTFRRDLFFRLNVFPIALPPLRQRVDDMPRLVDALLLQLAGYTLKVTSGAMAKLRGHSFPGNVRELRNVLERAQVLCKGGAIEAEHIVVGSGHSGGPSVMQQAFGGPPALHVVAPAVEQSSSVEVEQGSDCECLEDIERGVILKVLRRCEGNRTEASRRLGISVRTLRNRLRDYRAAGIQVPAPRGQE